MPYYATGESRDSYITGIRPGNRYGAPHDVEKRRDNLPDNVFNYIKEGVLREQRQQRIEEDSRAQTKLEMFAKPPKSRHVGGQAAAGGGAGGQAASAQMRQLEQEAENRERHAALAELYAREKEEWVAQLGARGLAAHRT